MTPVNRHRIQRQVLEISMGTDLSRAHLREAQLRDCCQRVLPDLCTIFDTTAGTDHLLRIDRLEIDLGDLGETDWEPRFRERLVSEVTRQLSAYEAQTRAGSDDRGERPDAGPFEAFLFFLARGHLPWWFPRPEQSWRHVLESHREALRGSVLRTLMARDPSARRRLIEAADDALLEELVFHWGKLPASASVLETLAPVGLSAVQTRSWRRRGWLLILAWVCDEGAAPSAGVELIRGLLRARDDLPGATRGASPSNVAEPRAEKADRRLDESLPAPWREWWRAAAVTTGDTLREIPAGDGVVVPFRRHTPRATSKSRRPDSASADESVYLYGAGVLLAHPFLEPLFRDRGLLDGKDFQDASARQRAVGLVGYLGWGAVDPPEQDLVIAKLLCGMPIAEPLELTPLEDGDAAACDELLTAMLSHWSALRSGSREWLRAQFFLRDGKLEVVDGGHRLTVERRAQDVLLARLPWGFGVIALPWMPERLFVSWID